MGTNISKEFIDKNWISAHKIYQYYDVVDIFTHYNDNEIFIPCLYYRLVYEKFLENSSRNRCEQGYNWFTRKLLLFLDYEKKNK